MDEEKTSKAWRDVGGLLDLYNIVENLLATVIVMYVAKDERLIFAQEVLLHNTMIDFVKKGRLVRAISRDVGGPDFKLDDFFRISQIRNALAHGLSGAPYSKWIEKALEGRDPNEAEVEAQVLVIRVMDNNCTIKERPRDAAIAECLNLMTSVQDQLAELLSIVGPQEEGN